MSPNIQTFKFISYKNYSCHNKYEKIEYLLNVELPVLAAIKKALTFTAQNNFITSNTDINVKHNNACKPTFEREAPNNSVYF